MVDRQLDEGASTSGIEEILYVEVEGFLLAHTHQKLSHVICVEDWKEGDD